MVARGVGGSWHGSWCGVDRAAWSVLLLGDLVGVRCSAAIVGTAFYSTLNTFKQTPSALRKHWMLSLIWFWLNATHSTSSCWLQKFSVALHCFNSAFNWAATHAHHTHTHTHAHTTVLQPSWILSGTTRVSWHQKGKTSLDLLEQEIHSIIVIRHTILLYTVSKDEHC